MIDRENNRKAIQTSTANHEPVRFVLLFEGRTGSSYTMSALKSHPRILTMGEEFVDHLRHGKLSKVRAFLCEGEALNNSAVGFKTKFSDVGRPAPFGRMMEELNAKVICLCRRNHVKQAISFITGEKLYRSEGAWNRYDGRAAPQEPIDVDPDHLDELINQIKRREKKLIRYVVESKRPTLLTYYEELLDSRDHYVETICGFLGVSQATLTAKTTKNTSDDLSQVIRNFESLRKRYEGTPYYLMFGEE